MQYNADAQIREDMVRLSDDEIQVVKDALKTKLFKRDEPDEVRLGKFQTLVTALCEKFQVPEVRLELNTEAEIADRPGWLSYNGDENRLYINKRFSLATTLTGLGFALVHHKGSAGMGELLGGLDRNRLLGFIGGFGVSVFKQAAPKMFKAAKDAGKLMGYEESPYTDGGRLPVDNEFNPRGEESNEGDDCDTHEAPDIDPENRTDDPDEGKH